MQPRTLLMHYCEDLKISVFRDAHADRCLGGAAERTVSIGYGGM